MIIEVNNKGILQREIIFKLSKKKLDLEKKNKICDLTKSLNLDGFRKGYIPVNVVLSRFGDQIYNEVLNNLLYENLLNFLKEKNLNFVQFPVLEKSDLISSEDFLVFYFSFEVYPTISINLDSLSVIRYVSSVEESDVNDEIDRLRNFYGNWVSVDSVELNDRITFKILKRDDDTCFFFKENVIVNSNYSYIPNFLSFIVNKKVNINYSVLFDNFILHELNDLTSDLVFRVISIERFVPAKLDDVFYQRINFDCKSDFWTFIRFKLNNVLSSTVNRLFKKDLFCLLVTSHIFDIPSILIDKKCDKLKKEKSGSDLTKISDEVKLDLIFKEIIKKFNIYVSKDEVFEVFNNMHGKRKNLDTLIYSSIENELYVEKIVSVLVSKINIDEKTVNFKDLLILGNTL